MRIRIALIVLAALLALPLAPTAAPVAAKNRSRTVTKTFRNTAPISLLIAPGSPVSAALYPSPIAVSGLKGTVRDVNVRLDRLSHDDTDEVHVLLVGPGGQTAIVMADAGGAPAIGVTLGLDDEADAPLAKGALHPGTFLPTNINDAAIAFNAPAPTASANAALSVFDGTDPNGTWRLFVQDDNGPKDSGAFAGGWELEITAKAKAKNRKKR
ncbi:MAG: hypothetical protein ACRDJC_09730 [Thermomicrobiales bacterium]